MYYKKTLIALTIILGVMITSAQANWYDDETTTLGYPLDKARLKTVMAMAMEEGIMCNTYMKFTEYSGDQPEFKKACYPFLIISNTIQKWYKPDTEGFLKVASTLETDRNFRKDMKQYMESVVEIGNRLRLIKIMEIN
jgi:hypothetical protein